MNTKIFRRIFALLLTCILLLSFGQIYGNNSSGVNTNSCNQNQFKNVYINYAINRLVNIDYVAETFEIDFYMQILWCADTLELKKKLNLVNGTLINNTIIDRNDLTWYPENDFTNAKTITSNVRDCKYIYRDGYILSDQRFIGVFYNDMKLKDFPFDNQDLKIILEDFNKTKDQLVYKYGSPFNQPKVENDTISIDSDEAFETNLNFSEFCLNKEVKHIIADHLYEFTADKEVYSKSTLILNISREPGYYLTKIIFITLLIVIMSWCVFFIDVSEIGNRAGFSIAAFLALVGHNYVTNSILPRIPYLTIMDYLTLGASFLIFLAALENLVAYLVYRKNKLRIANNQSIRITARDIDRISIWVFPSTLLFLIIYIYSLT